VLSGTALAWRQFADIRDGSEQHSSALLVRALGALVLVAVGILLFFVTSDSPDGWTVVIASASVLLGVVCVFELPLVVLALVNIGVLTSAALRRNRRRGYFLVAVAALALPGPDPVTTLLELLPMWALFEGSIWLAVLAERRAARLSVAGAQA